MSGGLDSATLAWKALSQRFDILPININYGQKNIAEAAAFKNLIREIKNRKPKQLLNPIELNLIHFMEPIIKNWQELRDNNTIKNQTQMEFYTPSRNLLFVSIASMVGEIIAINNYDEVKIGIGIHKHKTYSRDYWDITPNFAHTFNNVLKLNNCQKIEIYSPYVNKYKKDIIKDCVELGVPWEKTWTCYNPVYSDDKKEISPCQKCEACIERESAGIEAGIPDINKYKISF